LTGQKTPDAPSVTAREGSRCRNRLVPSIGSGLNTYITLRSLHRWGSGAKNSVALFSWAGEAVVKKGFRRESRKPMNPLVKNFRPRLVRRVKVLTSLLQNTRAASGATDKCKRHR
jgi:hypothetical protein